VSFRHRAIRSWRSAVPVVSVVSAIALCTGWAQGSDTGFVGSQEAPDTLYLAQVGAGVVEAPSGVAPSKVCGNGFSPSQVGWPGPGAGANGPTSSLYTWSYVWLFGPASAPYESGGSWAYQWGQQQAYGAYLQRTQGAWAPDTQGGTLFADIETGTNEMCGVEQASSGWYVDGNSNDQQQDTNVIQGFLAEARVLTGNPGGLYWNPTTFAETVGQVGPWPVQDNYYVYWQAGGCAPDTSNCSLTTTTSEATAQQEYEGSRCSENIDQEGDDLLNLWQYDPGNYDFDLAAEQPWTEDGNWFRPSENGC
jgi:hypothetical protein